MRPLQFVVSLWRAQFKNYLMAQNGCAMVSATIVGGAAKIASSMTKQQCGVRTMGERTTWPSGVQLGQMPQLATTCLLSADTGLRK